MQLGLVCVGDGLRGSPLVVIAHPRYMWGALLVRTCTTVTNGVESATAPLYVPQAQQVVVANGAVGVLG